MNKKMQDKPDQCFYVGQNGHRCSFRAWKAGERFCIQHDIQAVISTGPLRKTPAGTESTTKPDTSKGNYAV